MPTITKRGDTYRIRVSEGYDASGKQITRSMTYKPTPGMTQRQIDKAVQTQAILFEEKVKSGHFINSNIKLADFAEQWFEEYAEKQLKPKTVAQYKALYPRINDGIGHLRLDRIQPHHIIALYDELAKEGIRADTKYKSKLDFKELLKSRQLTKVKLAELAGVSVCTLDSVTKGNNISHNSAVKIAEALKMPLSKLFEPISKGALSGRTVKHHHILLSSILHTAVQWQIITANPCERVKPPKVHHKEPTTLDDEQSIDLLELLDKEDIKYRTIIKLLVLLGLRRAEVLGLKWCDVDFENNLVTIDRTIQYLSGKGTFESDTKTSSSQRTMKVPQSVITILSEYKTHQAMEILKLGDYRKNTGFIFTKADGTPIHPDTLTAWFSKFVERNNLPKVTLHSLRHTNATLLIANGTPLTTVSKRLGHASPATTAKIYAHAIRTADEIAAQEIENILTAKKKKQA